MKTKEAYKQKNTSNIDWLLTSIPWNWAKFHKWRHSPSQNCPHFRHQLKVQRSLRLPSLLTTVDKFGDSHYSLWFNNSPEQFTELKKSLFLWLKYYYRKMIQIGTNQRKKCIGWGLRGFRTLKFVISSPDEVTVHCPPPTSQVTIWRTLPTWKIDPNSGVQSLVRISLYKH